MSVQPRATGDGGRPGGHGATLTTTVAAAPQTSTSEFPDGGSA